jgi:hypothetical protein
MAVMGRGNIARMIDTAVLGRGNIARMIDTAVPSHHSRIRAIVGIRCAMVGVVVVDIWLAACWMSMIQVLPSIYGIFFGGFQFPFARCSLRWGAALHHGLLMGRHLCHWNRIHNENGRYIYHWYRYL